jgi:hypothetical protein
VEVAIWLKNNRKTQANQMPVVNDLKMYGDGWNAWWWSMQPSWRDGLVFESPVFGFFGIFLSEDIAVKIPHHIWGFRTQNFRVSPVFFRS